MGQTSETGMPPGVGIRTGFRRPKRQNNLIAFLFLLPTVAMILVFNYYPAIAAFVYSFTSWNGFNAPVFNGLDNFREIFGTKVFSQAFWNLLWLTLFQVVASIIFPLLVARMIYKVRNQKLQNVYRMLFVFPLVIPGMIIILLWQFILNPDVGMLNALLSLLGVPEEHLPLWLGSMDTALVSLMLIGFPWVSGVSLLIFLAGFQSIPQEIIESATVDGAKGFRLFYKIEFPLVISQIKLILILTIIGSLQSFQTQLVLTGGGPGYSTTVPGLVMYQEAMINNRMGFACAVGVILFILIFALTIINNKYLKSSTEFSPK
ncbi:carbohydrate ABC transporter permease [Paenibacillus eucommiae]|uniref:Raffinose/stachyose/melibiose transport system permease protein n=1 Tax=Paenibacillus eucommiae TaxID=1355755 RepID=A0ABS4J3V1_9BACL|nr:sugar ABC transporter permease [Paenibacillus eucommiae]MBP1994485.1 raffinose/stachyose/melibiose transport system permease protein [Paenibacillus eucommiae]